MPRKLDQFEALVNTDADAVKALLGEEDNGTKQEALESEEARHIRMAYEALRGYTAKGGHVYEVKNTQGGDALIPLATCAPLIEEEITRDDGAGVRKEYIISGVSAGGAALHAIALPAAKFASMGWLSEHWGTAANIFPGSTIKDKLRFAITAASQGVARQVTVYAHTGWRKIGSKMAFLFNGGAIGADNVRVEMEGLLSHYALHASTVSPSEAVKASLSVLEAATPRVSIPLLAHTYLAPLCHFMTEAGISPAYVIRLIGGTGTRKTTIAALFLQHFGPSWNNKRFPASFSGDTDNALRRKAFLAKDVLFLLDDKHPTTGPAEKRLMDRKEHTFITAYGDSVGRGRLRSDLTLEQSQAPRGLAIMTGEDGGDVSESGNARTYSIEMRPGDVPICQALNSAQKAGESGLLAHAMRLYIEQLIPKTSTLPDTLRNQFRLYRTEAQEKLQGKWGRLSEAAAWLMLGWAYALTFFVETGVLEAERSSVLWNEGKACIYENVLKQQVDLAEDQPGDMFLATLRELRMAGSIHLRDIAVSVDNAPAASTLVGYTDTGYYYLLPSIAYTAVSRHFAASGRTFPISKNQLWKRLLEDDKIIGSGSAPTRTKYIPGAGSTTRCLWIPRKVFDDSDGIGFVDDLVHSKGFTPIIDQQAI